MPPDATALTSRLRWLFLLRWIAVVAVVLTVAIAAALGVVAQARPLLAVAAFLGAANIVFYFLERRGRSLPFLASAHVVGDMIALTFLLHYAGGSNNPFAFFYVFHVIIASILFSERAAYLAAVLAALLFGGLTLADIVGACPRHPIAGIGPPDPTYAWGRFAAFATTVVASAYFGATIMKSLREKQAELRDSQERLTQAEKLAAIGQLAAGIAHELNTPLGSILVAADAVRESPGPENAELLADIARETKRCKEITRALLDFSRKRDIRLVSTDAGEVVKQAVGLVKREAGARAACVEVEGAPGLPEVKTDAGALGQVVVNVIKNALDAVEGRPAARVRVTAEAAGGAVAIRVKDNGRGIAPADMKKIYEPFFTTKEVGKGTGLGLSLSYAIMQDLKGEIEVASEVGVGTTVTLRLPG